MERLREVLTEENTDKLLKTLDDLIDVPKVPDAIVFKVLDSLLPDVLIQFFETILDEDEEPLDGDV